MWGKSKNVLALVLAITTGVLQGIVVRATDISYEDYYCYSSEEVGCELLSMSIPDETAQAKDSSVDHGSEISDVAGYGTDCDTNSDLKEDTSDLDDEASSEVSSDESVFFNSDNDSSNAEDDSDIADSSESVSTGMSTEYADEEDIPYGLMGLPEDYVLTSYQIELRQKAIEKGVYENISHLKPGQDYVEDELVVIAYSLDEAEAAARAYNGIIKSYRNNVAIIQIDTECLSVQNAMELVEHTDYKLPPASPNYIIHFEEPIKGTTTELKSNCRDALELESIPIGKTWESSSYDDEYLDPSSGYYQWFHDYIYSYAAWAALAGESCADAGIRVAVIDSGVSSTHPDLNVTGVDYHGGLDTEDYYGHGTHVAGIVGACINNGQGGAGIAPGIQILSYRVGGYGEYASGEISTALIIEALEHIANGGSRRADIVNISIGIYYYIPALELAICDAYNAGVTIVASLGNDACECIQYPAGHPHVIGVSATDMSGKRAYFSNWGQYADIAAPGLDIPSTYYNALNGANEYCIMSGTSMSAPVVTGACALYMCSVGYTDPDTMETILKKSVTKAGSSNIGTGVINLSKMFSMDLTAPYICIKNEQQLINNFKNPIPYTSEIYLEDSSVYANGTIVFTINGQNPSISGGNITNGYEYGGVIKISDYIEDDRYKLSVGKKIVLKAITVNNMGTVSKVSSISFIVAACPPKEIEIKGAENESTIISGTTLQLTAIISPAKATQKVTWSIDKEQSDELGATINSSGKLSTKKGKSGTLIIRCTSAEDSNITSTLTLLVDKEILPVKTIKLDKNKTILFYRNGENEICETIAVASITDTKGIEQSPLGYSYQWTSSNSSVATVIADKNGTAKIIAHKKGSAIITCKVLDGSGKTASCNVTVNQLVEQVVITGQPNVALGTKATYKASVSPTNAYNKNVTWSLAQDEQLGCRINAKNGQLNVPANADTGIITIVATTNDGSHVFAEYEVNIIEKKATSIAITTADESTEANYLKYNKGKLTAIQLYSVDIRSTTENEKIVQLSSNVSNETIPAWSSSNTKVVTVDDNGIVTAVKAGKAVITCKALDGSGKKATVTISVITPVSYMYVGDCKNLSYIRCGQSTNSKLIFGSTYGKPTNSKVTWQAELVAQHYTERGYVYVDNIGDNIKEDVTRNKYITINSKGSLSINKKLGIAYYGGVYADYRRANQDFVGFAVKVTATATDGTGAKNYYYIPIIDY